MLTALNRIGLTATLLVSAAIALPSDANAQSPSTPNSLEETETKTDLANANLDGYSPETAPLLYQGRTGDTVEEVQSLLEDLGFFYGVIDGVYGSRTTSSVVTFQRSRNLVADGIIGENTWEALLDAYNRTNPDVGEAAITDYDPETAPTLYDGVQGPAVEAVQAALKQNNYYTGAVDGIYGRSTRSAVRAFQDGHVNLYPDGIVGENTWEAMIEMVEARG
jgi:peptidoglycan hydrolase-like protein with peptidoglycan-binding domain